MYAFAPSDSARSTVCLIFGCCKNDDRRFLRLIERKHCVARYFRDIKIKNDQIRLEVRFIQYLQCLFAIAGDMQMNRYLALDKSLSDQESVACIVLHEKYFRGGLSGSWCGTSNRLRLPVVSTHLNLVVSSLARLKRPLCDLPCNRQRVVRQLRCISAAIL